MINPVINRVRSFMKKALRLLIHPDPDGRCLEVLAFFVIAFLFVMLAKVHKISLITRSSLEKEKRGRATEPLLHAVFLVYFLDDAMGLMPLHINRRMRTSRTEVLAGTTADAGLHIDHRDLQ